MSREEAASLGVRLASQSAFRQANLEFNPALSALRFSLERRNDSNFVVRITSLQPVNEPFLDVLLELTWATGRVLREYTVLLDPPSLRATPDVLPPVTAQPTPAPLPVPAPAQVPPPVAAAPLSPAPTAPVTQEPPAPPAAAPAPTPRAAAPAPAPTAGGGTYTVKPGDTLGRIASQNRPANVSLDQMLVAMFRANPNAFINNNMNLVRAGSTLTIPGSAEAEAIAGGDARREVAAQSADFAQYKSRLAQAATGAAGTAAAAAPSAAAATGRVTTQVEDKSAPTKAGDQLQIAKAESGTATPAAKSQDEAVARQRAQREQEERAAELKKANEQLKKALELQSKAGAAAQQKAESKPEPAKAAPPAVAPPPVTPPVVADAAKAPEPVKAEPPKVEAPKVEPPKVEAPKAETKPAAAPQPAAPETGFLEGLMRDSTTLYALGALIVLLGAFLGLNIYRKRKVEKGESFAATGEGLRGNSLFGQTGGQSVDTGATSTFNSSFIPAASQLDSNEVDPVAEADVYIAYGREEQAEDILKEALRVQPDRHAVRVKLLEIYSRRADLASFNAVAQELRDRTGGIGEDWDRAMKLGRALDPANPMYAGAGAAMEAAMRGPTTELRLNPNTTGGGARPATLGAIAPKPPTYTAPPEPKREPTFEFGGGVTAVSGLSSKLGVDSKMTADTAMQIDSRMTADTSMTPDVPQTRFEATVPLEDPVVPPAPRAGASDPFGATTSGAVDFGALDFDLGPTKFPATEIKTVPATPAPPAVAKPVPTAFEFATAEAKAQPVPVTASPATIPDLDISFPPTNVPSFKTTGPTTTGRSAMPEVDLSLPNTRAPAPAFSNFAGTTPQPAVAAASALEEALSRPTLLGEVGALPDEQAPRLTSNTDQATVPLIDFDLTGADVEIGGRRTETQAGSPMAAQMATKLDLARGYIDLGVKDGARELLEEVMRDGTREQRQSAVELLKQVEN